MDPVDRNRAARWKRVLLLLVLSVAVAVLLGLLLGERRRLAFVLVVALLDLNLLHRV